jgi:hypothetical protein
LHGSTNSERRSPESLTIKSTIQRVRSEIERIHSSPAGGKPSLSEMFMPCQLQRLQRGSSVMLPLEAGRVAVEWFARRPQFACVHVATQTHSGGRRRRTPIDPINDVRRLTFKTGTAAPLRLLVPSAVGGLFAVIGRFSADEKAHTDLGAAIAGVKARPSLYTNINCDITFFHRNIASFQFFGNARHKRSEL